MSDRLVFRLAPSGRCSDGDFAVGPRGRHAVMLDYARRRRLRARLEGEERGYWRAAHADALGRATDLRRALPPLP